MTMVIKPLAGQLKNDFSGIAANETMPLHEKLLAIMAHEQDDIVLPFRNHVLEIFKQMNLWTAQARQNHLQQGLYSKHDHIIVTQSSVGIWLTFSPEAWDEVIDDYMKDMQKHNQARFQEICSGVTDKPYNDPQLSEDDQAILRLAFEEHYKEGMTALYEVGRTLEKHLPGVSVKINIGHLHDEIGRAYVQPVMSLLSPENVDLRDIVRNFIERKTLFGVAQPSL